MTMCKCGCGQLVENGNDYIQFHHLQVHNKDAKFRAYLSELKRKTFQKSTNHPCYGKHLSETTKKKISIARTGSRRSLESRKKQSETILILWAGHPEKNPAFGKPAWNKGLTKYSDQRVMKYALKRLSQRLPQKDTLPERIFQNELSEIGIMGWVKHHPIPEAHTQVDIYFPQKRLCVFIDGDYWHNLPNMIIKDQRVNSVLKQNGYSVIRFWEHEIKGGVQNCIKAVQ